MAVAERPASAVPAARAASEGPGVLARIQRGLDVAGGILQDFPREGIASCRKAGGSLLTEADTALDEALRSVLLARGEGWLSEESADSPDRLRRRRLWVVDPLDGTEEFVSGIPEWCVSIGFVEDGQAVAGGIHNGATGETILGAAGAGVRRNGRPARTRTTKALKGSLMLASRSEVLRGEWKRFEDRSFTVRPTGSVAYKLGLVAAGLADATWTLAPKHEWDVAAGVALVRAAGGEVRTLQWRSPIFNRESPRLDGLVACCPGLVDEIGVLLDLPVRSAGG